MSPVQSSVSPAWHQAGFFYQLVQPFDVSVQHKSTGQQSVIKYKQHLITHNNQKLFIIFQNLYQNRFLGLVAMASPTRSSQTRQRCKDAVRHSYGPESFTVNGLNQEAFMLGLSRSTSDTDLVSPDARSTLTISSSHYTIGQSEDLVITWDIKEEVDAGDWIGMYFVGKL